MADREQFTPEDYDPSQDEELIELVQKVMNKWKSTHEDVETGTMMRRFLLIGVAEGFREDGKPVSQFMTVPYGGSEEDMLGLIHGADTRFRAEIIATILDND